MIDVSWNNESFFIRKKRNEMRRTIERLGSGKDADDIPRKLDTIERG